MSTQSPDELMSLWAQERLAPERAIGQLLQHLAATHNMLNRQSQSIAQLRAELAAVTSTTTETSTTTTTRRRVKQ